MSTGLTDIQIIHFDAQVKAAYQNGSILRNTVRLKTGIIGYQTKFRRVVRGVSSPRIPQTPVVPMGTQYGEATCTLADWHAADYLDVQDQNKTNIAELPILAENIGAANGRRVDQIIIDALAAAKPGAADIVHGSVGLTFDKLVELESMFVAAAIPEGDRFLLIEAEGKRDLIGEAKLTSKDYVDRSVIETGRLPPRLMGFNIIVLDAARDEGGLPLSGSTQTAYAWDRRAMGLALGGEEMPVQFERVANMNSTLAAQYISAGAVGIDTAGIFEIEYTV